MIAPFEMDTVQEEVYDTDKEFDPDDEKVNYTKKKLWLSHMTMTNALMYWEEPLNQTCAA